ncbi:sigma-54 dependent transcriptional regulator [Desulfovibrio sp. OttesenSCG-928-O18]|nr:sigma-54 dependent transcriptional regulator [Desulfovibrio sp. OttesenSCG-928-O18]
MRQSRGTILVVDDEESYRKGVIRLLTSWNFTVWEAEDGDHALSVIEEKTPDIILVDFKMPGRNGLEMVREFQMRIPQVPIIMVTNDSDVKLVVQAMRDGAYNYLLKPLDPDELSLNIEHALEKRQLERKVKELRKQLHERHSIFELMGQSDQVRTLARVIEKVAPSPFTVLIEGESGSGKEVVARAVHNRSAVRNGPFVPVDCGAIPETLIESELFGYVKGAFTGALSDKPGHFEMADKGTLFLDEIANLPYAAQQKLLRVIQEQSILKLGSSTARSVDVRIIAATNRPLEQFVEERTFRSDLYYRLKEVTIKVPPLRLRTEDIIFLGQRFLSESQIQLAKKSRGFNRQALEMLLAYSWPGNVRELRNVVRQAILLCDENDWIAPEHLMLADAYTPQPAAVPRVLDAAYSLYGTTAPHLPAFAENNGQSLAERVKEATASLENDILRDVLQRTGGNKMKAAKMLQVDYKTLLRKIKQYEI